MADGGQISWQNENQRRHGKLEAPENQDTLRQRVFGTENKLEKVLGKGPRRSREEDKLREKLGKREDP